jgi:hypothetical protein
MTVCGGKARTGGKLCTQPAGWGTDHLGQGRCKLHGGCTPGRPLIHGRYSLVHRESLAAKHALFLGDPAPDDLSHELALTRALLQDYLDRFMEGTPMTADESKYALEMIDAVSKLVERISRIQNATALTQAEVRYLVVRMADLLREYIDDPDRRAEFMGKLTAAIGGGGDAQRTPRRLAAGL